MNNHYKKSILLLGVVLPAALIILLFIVGLTKFNGFNVECEKREADFKKVQMLEINSKQLKQAVESNAEQMKLWTKLMDTETRGTFITRLNEIQRQFKATDLKKTSHNWVNISEGIGRANNQPASQVEMSFLGTYSAMQLAMLDLETELPQLQLDSLIMTPVGEESNLIEFDTVFTLWTK